VAYSESFKPTFIIDFVEKIEVHVEEEKKAFTKILDEQALKLLIANVVGPLIANHIPELEARFHKAVKQWDVRGALSDLMCEAHTILRLFNQAKDGRIELAMKEHIQRTIMERMSGIDEKVCLSLSLSLSLSQALAKPKPSLSQALAKP